MSKFHINKHGVPAPCKAQKGNCPLGGDEYHYETQAEAQEAADQMNSEQHGIIPGVNGRSEAHNEMKESAENADFKSVENNMVYHKAEDVEGAYNVINGMRNKNGKIAPAYEKLSKERAELQTKLHEERKNIEKDIYENGELGAKVREHEAKIAELESEKEQDNSNGACPKCGEGTMVERKGKYGTFMACNKFPKCKHTEKPKASDKQLPKKIESAKRNRQIALQNLQAEAKKLHAENPDVKKLQDKFDKVDNQYKIAEYANKYENPVKNPLYPNRSEGGPTPIEKYYEERKAADAKIEKKIGKNEIALNSGQMKDGNNKLNADLKVDKSGKINNLYIESESNKGEVNKVVAIHESGEGNLELDNGEKITMQYATNWRTTRGTTPPQMHKLYTTEAKGKEYKGSKNIIMAHRDSSD